MAKKTLDDVLCIIENEGLGYAVQYYMAGEDIEDPVLAEMWSRCAEMLNAIMNYLEVSTEQEIQMHTAN